MSYEVKREIDGWFGSMERIFGLVATEQHDFKDAKYFASGPIKNNVSVPTTADKLVQRNPILTPLKPRISVISRKCVLCQHPLSRKNVVDPMNSRDS
jgi:hypothetical protein